jgi:hypothetical protein
LVENGVPGRRFFLSKKLAIFGFNQKTITNEKNYWFISTWCTRSDNKHQL